MVVQAHSVPYAEFIRNEEQAIGFLHFCITKTELHERDEFFRIDGIAIKDPHRGDR